VGLGGRLTVRKRAIVLVIALVGLIGCTVEPDDDGAVESRPSSTTSPRQSQLAAAAASSVVSALQSTSAVSAVPTSTTTARSAAAANSTTAASTTRPSTTTSTTVPQTTTPRATTTAPPTTVASTTTAAPVYNLAVTPTCVVSATLRLGDTGDDVRCLQQRLNQVMPASEVAVDGVFSGATDNAVRLIQSSQELAVDGVVGPQTAGVLDIWNPAPEPPAVQPAVDLGDAYFENCSAARAAGAAPLFRGDPGYRSGLDRDDDGVACE
jgi:murein L,D-transpeptidase YcbB/YkuD